MYCCECDYFSCDEPRPSKVTYGECRRKAPLPVMAKVSFPQRDYSVETVIWPVVHGSFWCGEFKENENRKEAQ